MLSQEQAEWCRDTLKKLYDLSAPRTNYHQFNDSDIIDPIQGQEELLLNNILYAVNVSYLSFDIALIVLRTAASTQSKTPLMMYRSFYDQLRDKFQHHYRWDEMVSYRIDLV